MKKYFLSLVLFCLIVPCAGIIEASPLDVHLDKIRDLFENQFKAPAYSYLPANYQVLRKMQQECDAADMDYAHFTVSEAQVDLNSTVRMHIIMALAGAMLAYEDLYEYHIEIASRRIRRAFGNSNTQNAIQASLQGYALGGKPLDQWYSQIVGDYEDYRSKGKRVELIFNRSSRLLPLHSFSIKAATLSDASPSAQLFAGSLDLQLNDPIIKYWYLKDYTDDARQLGLEIEPTDYFIQDPADAEKAQWVDDKVSQMFLNKNPIAIFVVVPNGEYHFSPRYLPADGTEPKIKVDTPAGVGPDRIFLTMLESGTRVELRTESKAFTGDPHLLPVNNDESQAAARWFIPTWKKSDFRLGANERTRGLEGSASASMFHRLNQGIGLQTQADLAFRSNTDYEDRSATPFQPRQERPLAKFSGADFQFDVGPVVRYRHFQFAFMESLRYVGRESFDHGGVLGQSFLSFNYVSSRRGHAGVYFTRANASTPVVKTLQFDQVLFEETYLKVLDQIGVNFQLNVIGKSYVEGALGYLNSTSRTTRMGGVIRHVLPPLWNKISPTYEIGFNESFVGPKDSWRVGFGFRVGLWGSPSPAEQETLATSASLGASGPVPVFVPRVRYETRTRVVRRGNRSPSADAGSDQTGIRPGTRIVLNGTRSFDPDGDSLNYDWSQLSGEPVVLENRNTATANFIVGNGQAYSFQLIVTDIHGLRSSPAVVSIRTLKQDVPIIVTFRAEPQEIRSGQSAVLVYEARNAVRLRITGVSHDILPAAGTDTIKGTETVQPDTTITYTMTAYNAVDDTAVAVATIVVKPSLPVIASFTADRSVVRAGETLNLSWNTANAARVTLSANAGAEQVVPSSESMRTETPAGATTYTLKACNSIQECVSAIVTVGVSIF